jgi:hypothetical protein
MAEIDHLVIGAATLEAGAAYLERHLGQHPVAGGAHPGRLIWMTRRSSLRWKPNRN